VKAKIKAALALLAGSPEHVFAELAVAAADQAGMSKDAQDELRDSLSCDCADCRVEEPDEYAGLNRRDAAYYAGGENWRGL
jgi:hypothetical protein